MENGVLMLEVTYNIKLNFDQYDEIIICRI